MFGKKRVALKDYCDCMLNHIFSRHYDEFADTLLAALPPAYANVIDRDWYLENIRAAAIELLGVAFSRNLKRNQRADAFMHTSSFLRKESRGQIDYLCQQYNSAFGSDFQDGVRPMAAVFAQNCKVQGVPPSDVARVHYDAFYEVLRTFFQNMKSVKIV